MVQKTKVPKLQKLRWDRTHDLQATTDAPMYPLFCHHATVTDEIDKAPGVFVFHFPNRAMLGTEGQWVIAQVDAGQK